MEGIMWDGVKFKERKIPGSISADVVMPETSYFMLPSAGISDDYSRGDHTHGTPGITGAFAGYHNELLNAGINIHQPWVGSNIAGGLHWSVPASKEHPGVVRTSSSTTANSGAAIKTTERLLVLGGGETTEIIFEIVQNMSTITSKMGFQDGFTGVVPANGVWLNTSGLTLTGRTRRANIESITTTSYTMAVQVWYRGKIAINSNATRADFYLYAENGTQLWTSSLTTNIPTAGIGHGLVAFNSGTATVDMTDWDFMSLYINRQLVR